MAKSVVPPWDVGGWLRGLGLGQCEATFRENEIDADVLSDLTELDLEKIGLPLGHRKRLLKAIAKLDTREDSGPALRSAPAALQRQPIAEAAGERRHITVMFCDLVGSTGIAVKLDAEEWHDLVGAYLDAASAAVTDTGGKVAKKLGDGLVALFGYPVAHENDVERAAHAALAIRRSLTELNRKNDRVGKPALAVRIAIDSGPLVVDAAGEIFGEVPNIAEPSTVVVTTRLQRQIPRLFIAEDGGSDELKGVPQAVTLNGNIPASGGGHPITDYHRLIARAVEALDRNTGEARRALYERARNALLAELRSRQPALLLADITKERLALENAIRKVEAEAARKSRTESRTETQMEPRSAAPLAGTPDGGAQVASAASSRRATPPSADLPGSGWPAVLFSARDRLLSAQSSLRKQTVDGLRDVVGAVDDLNTLTTGAAKAARHRRAYEPEAPRYSPAEEPARSSREPDFDPHDLNSVDYDTQQKRSHEPAYEPEDLPPSPTVTGLSEEEENEQTRPQLFYRRPPSLPRPNWSRPLPQVLIVSGVMKVTTLNDARVLIERHLPADSRANEMWKYVSNRLREAARGHDVAEFSSVLEMALSLEGLDWGLE
jgi:class 3 adenylate cyclase